MPAGLPGSTNVQNLANPTLGASVLLDLLSGPKGSPKDNDKDYGINGGPLASGKCSTGALQTGIGFGAQNAVIGAPISRNFTDDYTPGVTKPDGTAATDSTLMYIGGGKSNPAVKGVSTPVPYTAGFGIGTAGQGGSRDAGAGPAFTGFLEKLVTATADVANGAAVETGFVNRSGVTIKNTQSTFGSSAAASAAPTLSVEDVEFVPEPPPGP